ncbi:MAG: septal ring lytic transglycosylase RlpA family protein [Alphaproteobacteria bacterium]|nr:septal ring lytic transglycosylase RlpA family protein [Alphaproteobacteria bacterium]
MTMAPKKATSRPYQIKGVWYYPQPHYEYVEEGTASLYGGGDVFHGRPTATGERYDMNGITAAHKTVPLPCMAKVTNLENGRELIVKVNDRGPFIPGRIIDVSRRSAQLLGFERQGLTKVRVETLVPESLALNGLHPSTVMVAQAPVSSPPISRAVLPVAAAAPFVTPKVSDPETLFEALEGNDGYENSPPPAPIIVTRAPVPGPREAAQTPFVESVVMAEAPAPITNPSPLPVKLEARPATGIFVYVGEYETYAKAQSVSRSLDGFADSPLGIIKNRGPQPYAARLGPLASMSEANQLLDQLVNAGHLISRIVIQR